MSSFPEEYKEYRDEVSKICIEEYNRQEFIKNKKLFGFDKARGKIPYYKGKSNHNKAKKNRRK